MKGWPEFEEELGWAISHLVRGFVSMDTVGWRGSGQCDPARGAAPPTASWLGGNSQLEERKKLSDTLPKTNRRPDYQWLRTGPFCASASQDDRSPLDYRPNIQKGWENETTQWVVMQSERLKKKQEQALRQLCEADVFAAPRELRYVLWLVRVGCR